MGNCIAVNYYFTFSITYDQSSTNKIFCQKELDNKFLFILNRHRRRLKKEEGVKSLRTTVIQHEQILIEAKRTHHSEHLDKHTVFIRHKIASFRGSREIPLTQKRTVSSQVLVGFQLNTSHDNVCTSWQVGNVTQELQSSLHTFRLSRNLTLYVHSHVGFHVEMFFHHFRNRLVDFFCTRRCCVLRSVCSTRGLGRRWFRRVDSVRFYFGAPFLWGFWGGGVRATYVVTFAQI